MWRISTYTYRKLADWSCECRCSQEWKTAISKTIARRTGRATRTIKNNDYSYHITLSTNKKNTDNVSETIPEVNERNKRKGGTTTAVIFSGLENVSEPNATSDCKFPIQEQGYVQGQTNFTTDFSFADSDFSFSDVQQLDPSLKKCFQSATAAICIKTKDGRWQFYI